MTFDRVTPVQKQEARDLIRRAKRRGFHIALTKDQLNDPEIVGKIFRIYGNPPSDGQFDRAARIAKYLKLKLTLEQAMNRWHCKKFVRDNGDQVPGGMPTGSQVDLAEQLAAYHGIDVPSAARVSLDDWNAFFQEHLGREERDLLHELEFQLGISVDMKSYGSMVYHLRRSKRIFSTQDSLRMAKLDRVRELLRTGEDPFSLALDLGVDQQTVFSVVKELEAEGHELVY